MFCRNCGLQFADDQPCCPRCGMSVAAQYGGMDRGRQTDPRQQYQPPYQQQYQYRQPPYQQPPGQYKKPRKTSTMAATMLMVFLSVAVITGTVAFILSQSWGKKISAADAYEEYKLILTGAKDEIDDYAYKADVSPVAVYDVNGSGVDDLVYLKASDSDDGSVQINFAVDDGSSIKSSQTESAKNFIVFYDETDGYLYQYIIDGDTCTIHRLSPADGKRLESYIRRYDEDSDEYVYSYEKDGEEQDADSAEEKFEQLMDDLKDDDIVVIVTDMDEEEEPELTRGDKDRAAVGYDEAIDIIDDKLSELETEPAEGSDDDREEDKDTETTATPTERKPEKIIVSDIPEQDSLKKFLQLFDFSAYYRKDTDDPQKYDCGSPTVDIVNAITTNFACLDMSLYPGEKTVSEIGKPDPEKRFEYDGYVLNEKSKIVWVMDNILNIDEGKISGLIDDAVSKNKNLYEYKKNGKAYLCSPYNAKGGPGYEISLKAARYDGEKYYIIFERYTYGTTKEKATDLEAMYVEMSLKTIDGKKYWTLYKHTKDIPDWSEAPTSAKATEAPKPTSAPEPTEAPVIDVFAEFSGEYYFTSGAGAWGTSLELNSDGSFSGKYMDTNMGNLAEGYDVEKYYSEFSGTFRNPQKINDYTYSFELDHIDYVYEPGTEEIVDLDSNGTKALMKYHTAYGLDNGTRTVYAYTADAPWDELPEGFKSWTSIGRIGNTSDELGRKCLYAVEPQYGWMGDKEN